MLKVKLAFKYLVHKRITLFAIISVMLGTTAFVVVIGVMDGYVTAFNERSRMILSDMVIRAGAGSLEQPEEMASAIKARIPEVTECSPNISGMAIIKIRGLDGSFSLKWCRFLGVDPVLERRVTGLEALAHIPAGSDDWIVPGADLLGTRSPENISQIILVTSGRVGGGPPVKVKLKPVSVVDFGLYQYDKEFAYVSREQAAELAGLPVTWASELRVRIRDPRRAETVRRNIQDLLDKVSGVRRFHVYRYQETSTMFRALKLQRSLATLILGCLFVAAGFAVIAICYMIVLQKTRDIGVLRTIGLSRRDVMTSFVLYGVTMGLSGVVLGSVVGVFVLDRMDWVRQTLTHVLGHDPFPVSLYALSEVPHEVNAWVLLLIAGIALVVSFLGSLYPAYRAARVNVVESLRYE